MQTVPLLQPLVQCFVSRSGQRFLQQKHQPMCHSSSIKQESLNTLSGKIERPGARCTWWEKAEQSWWNCQKWRHKHGTHQLVSDPLQWQNYSPLELTLHYFESSPCWTFHRCQDSCCTRSYTLVPPNQMFHHWCIGWYLQRAVCPPVQLCSTACFSLSCHVPLLMV